MTKQQIVKELEAEFGAHGEARLFRRKIGMAEGFSPYQYRRHREREEKEADAAKKG